MLFKLCLKADDPSTYLEIANKAWTMALDKMAPEKESMKRDQKRFHWLNTDALVQKQLKRQMEARYNKSHTEQDKKAYQQARNVYLYKLNRAKCLYLNAPIENTWGDQWKLFRLWTSSLKSLGCTKCCQAQTHHLQKALHPFPGITLKPYANAEDCLSVPSTKWSLEDGILQTGHSEQCKMATDQSKTHHLPIRHHPNYAAQNTPRSLLTIDS